MGRGSVSRGEACKTAAGVYFCACVKGWIEDGTLFLCESICTCVCVEDMHGCVIRGRVGRV